MNSREQSPVFRLDEPEFLSPMIAELKAVQPEFVILDVFNILHGADENYNTEMRKVLEELNRIHREIGCGVGVVHHFNKSIEGTPTQRLRGAGAIAGWAEWLIGVEAEDQNVRKMQFEIKAKSKSVWSEYRRPDHQEEGFFFFNWESGRQVQGTPGQLLSIPPTAFRNGDFSSLLPDTIIIDPTNREPFPNNMIPANRIDPNAETLLSFTPAPNRTGSNALGANTFLTSSFSTPTSENQYVARVDYNLSSRDALFARYMYDRLTTP